MACKFDIGAIKAALLEQPRVRARLSRDYGLAAHFDDESFFAALLAALDQKPIADPLNHALGPAAVYRAAVHSLGSNSRAWVSFIKREPELAALLCGYDPGAVADEVQSGALSADAIRQFFPGVTGRADAKAALDWALRLSARDFPQEVRSLYDAITVRRQAIGAGAVDPSHRMPMIVAFLAKPPAAWSGAEFLCEDTRPLAASEWKLAGMGAILGSEFFRNLGWSGFKPDRHVKRFLLLWAPEVVEKAAPGARRLADIIAVRDRETVEFLTYSLAGQALTPEGVEHSVADNLVWALGAAVEKKGKESGRRYVTPSNGSS